MNSTKSFYIDIMLKQNKIVEHSHNTFTVPCEKSKMIFFASSIMKNIVAPATWSRLPEKINLLLLDQYQVLVVYLNLLLSFYTNY